MISKIKAIQTAYSGIDVYFPKNSELAFNSNITLLVGQNGCGKTALYRMLATSIKHKNYFEKTGISRDWEISRRPSLKELETIAADFTEIKPGWFYTNGRHSEKIFELLKQVNLK